VIAGLVALVVGGARLAHFRTALDVPVALLVLAAALTTARGGHSGAPLRFVVTAVAFYYLTVVLLRRERGARGALALVALVAVAAAGGEGVAQVAQDAHTTYYREGLTPVVSLRPRPELLTRAVGTFPNPNLLAGYVLVLGPVAALAALGGATRQLRVASLALVALAYLGLLLTFSRAGAVAALLAGAAALVALRPEWRRPLALAGGVGLALVVAGGLATGGGLFGGFGRPEAWGLAAQVAVANPALGVGLSRAGDVMNATGDGTDTYRHAHNLWLTWWVETGPVGLLAIVWITGWLLLRSARDALAGSPWGAAGLAATVGFLGFSLVDHPANAERIALALWFLTAWVAAGAPALGGAPGRPRAARTGARGRRRAPARA
jgi:O-antigen ligase